MAFLSEEEIEKIGFKYAGKNISISEKASIYNPGKISIGDNCRIDDYSIISAGEGEIILGRNVHIACYASLIGKNKIHVHDFSGISSRVSVFSSSDDFSGNFLTGPTVNDKYRNVKNADVIINRHVIIGSCSVILPGVIIGEGAAVGALSLITTDINAFWIVSGNPAKFIRKRSNKLMELEKLLLAEE